MYNVYFALFYALGLHFINLHYSLKEQNREHLATR